MTKPDISPFSLPDPWSLVSSGYEQTTMAFLAKYSEDAVRLSGATSESAILDVACGPGTLTRLIAPCVKSVDALDFSPEMIELLQSYISVTGAVNITPTVGDGQKLPYLEAQFDAAFSMFGLMFFPDRLKGFSELYRTLRLGGVAVVSSWAPIVDSPAMMLMFGAMRAANPQMPEPQANIMNLENPAVLKSEMEQSGFKSVVVHPVTHGMNPTSVEDFWDSMIRGSAPIALMKQNTASDEWARLDALSLAYIRETVPEFPTRLTSSAWVGVGRK